MSTVRMFCVLALALALGGCEEESVRVYQVPKEENHNQPREMEPPMQGGQRGMTALPGMAEQAQAAGTPQWEPPQNWQAQSLGAVRRGSWQAPGQAGPADVSVTAFPGDVGGLGANVQRWAGQIGLDPAEAQVADVALSSGQAQVVDLVREGHAQATLAAILSHAGYSWFVKMTGPAETVAAQREAFLAFVDTITFPDAQNEEQEPAE